MTMTKSKKMVFLMVIGMAVFTAARAALLIMYYSTFEPYSTAEIAVAFLRGLRFDGAIFMTITAVFWALLLIPIKNITYHKVVIWLMYPVYIIIAGFLVSDVIYFGYVSRHMANEPFAIGEDFGFLMDMAGVYAFTIIGAIVLIIGMAFLWRKIVNIKIKPDKSWKWTALYSFLWVGIIFLIIRGTVSDKPISTIDAYVSGDSNLGNLTLNGLFSSAKYLSRQNMASESDYKFYDERVAEDILNSYRNGACVYPDGVKSGVKPNIVLILLESWSAYYVDSFGGKGFGLTPEFDKLASASLKFTNHYAPDKRSISAIQSALTGIPPIGGLPSLGFGLETMAKGNVGKLLQEKGYETIFVQSSRRRSFYMDAIAKSLGFKNYYGMEDTEITLDYPNKSSSKFGWDYETYMLLKDKINVVNNKPFFAFLFTGTTHTPYSKLPERFMKFPHGTETEDGFKNTLYYADWSLGEFFKSIKNEPWFNDTIFIITADHNVGKYEKTAFPEDYHVPFIIYSPLFEGGKNLDNVTGHIDITPTIIDIAGLSGSEEYLGQSVFCKDNNSFAVISEWNVAGIAAKDAHLRDSFGKVLDYKPDNLPQSEIERLEKALLSYYQVEFSKIFNRTEKK